MFYYVFAKIVILKILPEGESGFLPTIIIDNGRYAGLLKSLKKFASFFICKRVFSNGNSFSTVSFKKDPEKSERFRN